MELKSEMNTNLITASSFTTLISLIDRPSGWQNRKTSELNDILHQMYLADIYRIFHPNTNEYSFYSAEHSNSLKLTIYWNTNSNRYRKTEITPHILFDNYAIKLKINHKQNSGKSKFMEIKQLITEWWIKEVFLELSKNTNQQNPWDTLTQV